VISLQLSRKATFCLICDNAFIDTVRYLKFTGLVFYILDFHGGCVFSVEMISGHKTVYWVPHHIDILDITPELGKVHEVDVPGVEQWTLGVVTQQVRQLPLLIDEEISDHWPAVTNHVELVGHGEATEKCQYGCRSCLVNTVVDYVGCSLHS